MRLPKVLSIIVIVSASLSLSAQNFEGIMHLTKSNMMDVTRYVYYIKGNMVRIDELVEGSDKTEATLLVNLDTEQMVALSYERNLYMNRPKSLDKFGPSGNPVVKGQLKRSIHGLNCEQYRVKNKALDREIMYWVTEGDYAFFPKLMNILKRKDNMSTFYMDIPDLGNKLPLLAEENTLLREKKGFLQVDELDEKPLENALFEIPEGFAKVER